MFDRAEVITADEALAGRDEATSVPATHFVNGNPLQPPFPSGVETAVFGMGCFWGAEKDFWETQGVFTTAAGYAGGHTPNPTYEEVCSSMTGHTEVVLVAYDPTQVSYEELLAIFWEQHDPTQSMRQGNDRGTQYRSAIYTATDEQLATAKRSRDHFQRRLTETGMGAIATEIDPLSTFFYAEDYHQQYLAKTPGGYCPDHSCGVKY